MNNERLMWQGQLAQLKYQFEELELEASGLIISIRTLLNPHVSIITLPIKEIETLTDRLLDIITKMKELKIQIDKLEESLG